MLTILLTAALSVSPALPIDDAPLRADDASPVSAVTAPPSVAAQQAAFRGAGFEPHQPNLLSSFAYGLVGMGAGLGTGLMLAMYTGLPWLGFIATPVLAELGAALGVIAGGRFARQAGAVAATVLTGLALGGALVLASPLVLFSLTGPLLLVAGVAAVGLSLGALTWVYFAEWSAPATAAGFQRAATVTVASF